MLRVLKQLKPKYFIRNYRTAAAECFSSNKNNVGVTNNNLIRTLPNSLKRCVNFSTNINFDEVDNITFEKVCEETLESLTEFFDELVEANEKLKFADVYFSSGVLTINLGQFGTYVINKQSPNKQIWLSSPKSGPKRYDYVVEGNYWVYKHDMKTLHELLEDEMSNILDTVIDLSNCACYK